MDLWYIPGGQESYIFCRTTSNVSCGFTRTSDFLPDTSRSRRLILSEGTRSLSIGSDECAEDEDGADADVDNGGAEGFSEPMFSAIRSKYRNLNLFLTNLLDCE